jgi:hypothetical protein
MSQTYPGTSEASFVYMGERHATRVETTGMQLARHFPQALYFGFAEHVSRVFDPVRDWLGSGVWTTPSLSIE